MADAGRMRSPAALTRFLSRILPSFEKPDVYVVFLEFTPAHRRSALEILRPFVDRLFPGHRVRWTLVDNAFERDHDVPREEGAEVIAGDDSSREFSGFDRGIEWVKRTYQPAPGSVFILANDSFHRSYGSDYLARFDPGRVRAALRANDAVGYVDGYPSEVEVLGLPVQSWIRTSLVIVRGSVLDALGKLTIPVRDEDIFGGVDRFFLDDAPLSANYRRYIRAWLFGEDGEDFAYRWHSMRKLTNENLAEFRGKARAILCEHYFSARLRARNIGIYRVN
jgi:hypothetical protein